MRLCLVTETYPPEVNGVARTLGTLCRIMATRGHEVSVVRPRPRDAVTPVPGVGEVTVPGAPVPGYPRLRFGWPAPGRLARSWRLQRPDVVHVATEGPLGWSAVRLARRQGIPVASSFHTNFHEYGPHYGLKHLVGAGLAYCRWFHGRTAITLVPSLTARRRLLELGFSRLEVLSRGVDTRQFDPARRSDELRSSWGADPGDPVLLCVGRIAPEKNVELAIAAFREAQAETPRARLVLVGDGPAAPRLRQEHRDLVWAGERRGSDLGAHYASADLFLFPSLTETFGNVLVEAMAAGLAPVAFDYAAAAMHVRSGENGVAVPRGDREAFLAAAVGLALAPGLRRGLGRAARATAMGLSWERVADRWERILLRLAGE
jgi:glycosyltransferase involved in cell wall biosynthesis